ncbi:MAG: hypothetical protein C0606_07395 [Hyphomicrobiales bacterium]|nr:MAG: hypothetical protein C0606_07395 [Hyphomicrobiales bacterium]
MAFAIFLAVSLGAAFLAHALARRAGRNAVVWTWATALFPPSVLLLIILTSQQRIKEARP